MINLLSPQYKIEATREYYMRLGIVSVIFVIFLVVIAGVLLVPSYASVLVDERVKKEELVHLTGTRDPELEKISKSIQLINKNLSSFSEPYTQASFSLGVLDPVLKTNRQGISIFEISYAANDPALRTLSLRGGASSRENLLTFISELEKTNLFEKIDVPISNLLRDDNVTFDLVLKLKK